MERGVATQTGEDRQTGNDRTSVRSAQQLQGEELPDKEQDPEAPGVHGQAIAGGVGVGEDFRSQVRWSSTQSPHQGSLLQDPGLVKVCHLKYRCGSCQGESDDSTPSLFMRLTKKNVN